MDDQGTSDQGLVEFTAKTLLWEAAEVQSSEMEAMKVVLCSISGI